MQEKSIIYACIFYLYFFRKNKIEKKNKINYFHSW